MRLYKVDTIIKGELLKKGLSIHSYVKRAYLAMRFLKSINFDSAYYIKTATLDITDNKITLPDDFVGVARIGISNGQYMETLTPDQKLLNTNDAAPNDTYGGIYWYPNYNAYGENLGGYFGYSMLSSHGYKILFEENKIYINNNITSENDSVVLQYHTDGMEAGAVGYPVPYGTMYIHPYAHDALCAYMDWMAGDSSRLNDQLLERRYYNELRKYRARIRPLTPQMIKNSLRGNYHAGIKN